MIVEFVPDLSSELYHAHPAFSKSQLDKINRSPAHYLHSLNNHYQSEAMRVGSLMHTYILEPETVWDRYVMEPNGIDRRTKQGKAQWADFVEQTAGREVISIADRDKALAISTSVNNHPVASSILGAPNKVTEGSFFWVDEKTGLSLRCRPDLYLPDLGVIVDLKTSQSAKPGEFKRSAWNYRYHVQAAMYSAGVEAVTGQKISDFIFLVVETEAPFLVSVFYSSPEFIERGRWDYEQNLLTAAECKANDSWPGYGDELFPLGLPGWVK